MFYCSEIRAKRSSVWHKCMSFVRKLVPAIICIRTSLKTQTTTSALSSVVRGFEYKGVFYWKEDCLGQKMEREKLKVLKLVTSFG